MSDLVGNPEDRFSRVAAHFVPYVRKYHETEALIKKTVIVVVLLNQIFYAKRSCLHMSFKNKICIF